MTAGGGLRKRREHFFVQVPRETIRDSRLSFRARGLLAYLLDQPDGWDVRSETLAAESTEGREAVRTALRELGRYGYYRLERRRTRDGRNLMGTSISETPVASWVADFAEFHEKAVPVVEQPDGSFLVRHSDGTLTADGFEDATEALTDPQGGAPSSITGDGFPGAGEPDAGVPDSGNLGALREKEKGDREGRTTTTSLTGSAVEELSATLDLDVQASTTTPARAKTTAVVVVDVEAAFVEFWKMWPRTEGKADAKVKFAKAVKAHGLDVVMDGTRRYLADPNLPEPQFVKHAASWLHNKRYLDDEPLPPRIDGPRGAGSLNRFTDATTAGENWFAGQGQHA